MNKDKLIGQVINGTGVVVGAIAAAGGSLSAIRAVNNGDLTDAVVTTGVAIAGVVGVCYATAQLEKLDQEDKNNQ